MENHVLQVIQRNELTFTVNTDLRWIDTQTGLTVCTHKIEDLDFVLKYQLPLL